MEFKFYSDIKQTCGLTAENVRKTTFFKYLVCLPLSVWTFSSLLVGRVQHGSLSMLLKTQSSVAFFSFDHLCKCIKIKQYTAIKYW